MHPENELIEQERQVVTMGDGYSDDGKLSTRWVGYASTACGCRAWPMTPSR